MMQSLKLENGKYELRFDEASGALCAYRYGEPWQDFTGNKFIYLLMQAALAAEPQPAAPTYEHWRKSLAVEQTHDFDAQGRGYKKDSEVLMRMAWMAGATASPRRHSR